MWCFDENWRPVPADDYKRTRFRIKIDLTAQLTPGHALVVDYKTGKRWGNELKHEQQKTTYAIGVFCRKPEVTMATTELWYLDLPAEDIFATKLTRKQGMVLLRGLKARNERMLQASVFPAKPSKYNCKWCPFNGRHGEQVCKHAIL
jgi:hypothetical protein